MSSAGRILAMTPLLPWRPAILSPTLILRFWATDTRTRRLTPGWRSSLSSRRNSRISTTLPRSPWGRRSELESFTSRAFSPKIARRRRSSAVSSVSPFGRDLADEDVAGADLGADVDDALLVEVLEGLLADVRDVAGDLLGPELGVARLDLVLLDVDAREQVVADEAVADDDRVLVVAALPAHERDEDVPAEGELALLGRRAVGDRLRRRRRAAPTSTIGRWLMQVPWLLRTNFWSLYSSSSPASVSIRIRSAVTLVTTPPRRGDDDLAGVARGALLHAGADDRRLRLEERHGLALHVRAHQGAVGVVVLEERDERGRDGDDLLGADVHVLDLAGARLRERVAVARRDALGDEVALVVERRVGLGDDVLLLLVGREVLDLVGHDRADREGVAPSAS